MFTLTGRIDPPCCLRVLPDYQEEWITIQEFPSLEAAKTFAEKASGLPANWQEVNGGLESLVAVHNLVTDFDRARIVET